MQVSLYLREPKFDQYEIFTHFGTVTRVVDVQFLPRVGEHIRFNERSYKVTTVIHDITATKADGQIVIHAEMSEPQFISMKGE